MDLGKPRPIAVVPAGPRQSVQARFPDGTLLEGPVGVSLEVFVQAAGLWPQPVMAAIVNGRLTEMNQPLVSDADVVPLSIETSEGMRIYQRSLTFLLVTAVEELFPETDIVIDHSMQRGGFFCEIKGRPPFTVAELTQIEARMREIVAADEPIRRQQLPIAEAAELFSVQGHVDKVRLLKDYKEREQIPIYGLRGFRDYFYGYMVPSTRYLSRFSLQPLADGLILAFPTRFSPDTIPAYRQQTKLTNVFREHLEWMDVMGVEGVAELNAAIGSGRIREIVLVSEALHEQRIAEIAGSIAARRDQVRLVLIAGPSSSGKTTFSKRLAVQLLARGCRPVSIGLDDYFVDREHTPRDAEGQYDFEALEAVDLDLFNEQLNELCLNKEVVLPHFNFESGQRELGRVVKPSSDQVLLVEGIHGLNPRLVRDIPPNRIYRVYVSALTQLNVDSHNRVPTTDTRLIRRIVRDAQFRGYSALKTITRWESVLRGERRHIFPYQDNADEMFNSALLYELAVLRSFVEPLLRQVEPDDIMQYIEARRLLSFLSWFTACGSIMVPENSLLREFIGGSGLAQFGY